MSGHRPIAPCGTKSARNRHARHGETCEACKPAPRPKQPCGTSASYKRGCRCDECRTANRERQRKQTADARANKPPHERALAPCGTKSAKERHRRRSETCETCHPPRQIKLRPCGTKAAKERHKARGETCTTCHPPKQPTPHATRTRYQQGCRCEPCTTANREYDQEQRRKKGIGPRINPNDIIDEIIHLLNAGEGEHRILQATGYTGREDSLRQRLHRNGRNDLIPRIFTPWDLAA